MNKISGLALASFLDRAELEDYFLIFRASDGAFGFDERIDVEEAAAPACCNACMSWSAWSICITRSEYESARFASSKVVSIP